MNPKISQYNKKRIAVLVISFSVIIGFLFFLFYPGGGSTSIENPCVAVPGYSCGNVTLTRNGTVSLSFAQSLGKTIYGAKFACYVNAPKNFTSLNNISTIHTLTSFWIISLPCYGSNNTRLNNLQPGSSFSGGLWLEYTNSSQNSTYVIVRAAFIAVKVK